jgi:hypothetical protein
MKICKLCYCKYEELDEITNLCEMCFSFQIQRERMAKATSLFIELGITFKTEQYDNAISINFQNGVFMTFSDSGGIYFEYDGEFKENKDE